MRMRIMGVRLIGVELLMHELLCCGVFLSACLEVYNCRCLLEVLDRWGLVDEMNPA